MGRLAEIYVEVYTVFDVGEKWDKKSAYKFLEYWFKLQPDLAFVAEYNNKVAGAFVTGVRPWWDGNYLFGGEIFIHPDFQRKGIGTELLKKGLKTAREKYRVVTWEAFAYNKFKYPLSWYKKLGSREIKEWTMITADIERVLKKLK